MLKAIPHQALLQTIHQRALRLFGKTSVVDEIGTKKGLNPPRDKLLTRAQEALDQLSRGETPSEGDLEALAICIQRMRPAVPFVDGKVGTLPRDWALASAKVKGMIERYATSIAAILGADNHVVGTGILAKPGTLLTNRHVVSELQASYGNLLDGVSAIFSNEKRHRGVQISLSRAQVVLTNEDPSLDVAVILFPKQGQHAAQSLQGVRFLKEPPLATGQMVAAIGYPARDKTVPSLVREVFVEGLEIERLSPGELVYLEGGPVFHDCSTLSGSSGSLLFDWRTGAALGIHCSGSFACLSEAISAAQIYQSPTIVKFLG